MRTIKTNLISADITKASPSPELQDGEFPESIFGYIVLLVYNMLILHTY